MKILFLLSALCVLCANCSQAANSWYTKADDNGAHGYYNDAWSTKPIQLKGVSMTGFETGTRGTPSGGGYWLFDPMDVSVKSETIIKNLISTLKTKWGATLVRIPICGSAWLQNYNVQNWEKVTLATYQAWVDTAVKTATDLGMVVVLDNHLWAIGEETNKERNVGMEDGCTGINKVCVGVPECIDSCAPHDWYGKYSSARTGKTYNEGDDIKNWQCAIANADGCSMDNLKRGNNAEHFFNLWYDLANHYKNNSYVFFELINEPYQRKSAKFDDPACKRVDEGASFMCPPGTGFGDNLEESDYDWKFWSELYNITIGVIRSTGAQNIIQVSGLDWNYDYLGNGDASTGGPIARNDLLPWTKWAKNIGYSMHPYQHGSCCGAIGKTSDLSASDPYQSAFCMYGPKTASMSPLPIPDSITAGAKTCDSNGYTTTQNKKSPPCIWKGMAKNPSGSMGVCAGDGDACGQLSESACNAAHANWTSPSSGGWSKYVLPMQKFGPIMSTEFGPFDCSSPFTDALLKYSKQAGVSYTAWALWPQNSGGPGAGACGYPSVLIPTGGKLSASCGFGKCSINCETLEGCEELLKPLPWSGTMVEADIKGGQPSNPTPPPSHKCSADICESDSECGVSCKCQFNTCKAA